MTLNLWNKSQELRQFEDIAPKKYKNWWRRHIWKLACSVIHALQMTVWVVVLNRLPKKCTYRLITKARVLTLAATPQFARF